MEGSLVRPVFSSTGQWDRASSQSVTLSKCPQGHHTRIPISCTRSPHCHTANSEWIVCMCVKLSTGSVTVSEREHEYLQKNKDGWWKQWSQQNACFPITAMQICLQFPTTLSLSPSLTPSFPPPLSLSLSLIRMKTHLQSVGARKQLVTPPSHYDNWALWASCKPRKHIHTSGACWPSFCLSHTCTDSFHSGANVTRLDGDIHSDQMALCPIRDVVDLYVFGMCPWINTPQYLSSSFSWHLASYKLCFDTFLYHTFNLFCLFAF